MITRHLLPALLNRAAQYPVVTLTGPRQSGKTTLCRAAFPDKPYCNLERPDRRSFAQHDPAGFLAQFPEGAVLDEIQRVPELLSWIQVRVDERRVAGEFILTGSHQFALNHHISQSLAGRTALLTLLPLSIAELRGAGEPTTVDHLLFTGGYPRIYADHLDPSVMLGDYFATYVERDLRELIQLRHIREFEIFVRLAAGRTGQLLNVHSLAADAGISGQTAKSWLTLLEASYIIFLLPPWFTNIGKRLTKSPKLYFYDVGFAAWLIGITQASHLQAHPLRGLLFENMVVLEMLKARINNGLSANLHFYRDSSGLEVDVLLEAGYHISLFEIKSSQTVNQEYFKQLTKVAALFGERVTRKVVFYGGVEGQKRSDAEAMSYLNAGAAAINVVA